jgi:DNA-binding CsgD family transcriptional regulator
LRLLKDGLSTDAIAAQLGVSRFTARNHIQHALRKLGLHTRSQAVAAAFEQGLR